VIGTVGSGAEKARVARNAWKVPAVRAVDISGVHVAEWADDDQVVQATRATPPQEEVERALNRALMRHPRVSAFDVEAELSLGVVTLRGTVDNVAAARAAVETARLTRGVAAVIDRLEVRPGEPGDDGAVAERVRSALARDPYIDLADPLRVAVADGKVVLEGRVDSAFERAQATDVASRVRGVAAVESRVQLEEGARRPLSDPFVDPSLLDGNDWGDERAAAREAAAERGADAVAGVDDEALRERVARQLWWSPFVDQSKVEVRARDGVVILSGTVGSLLQSRMATSEAFEAGADWVENRLEVRARGS
jgi:osmotically-inducible protein OsmY